MPRAWGLLYFCLRLLQRCRLRLPRRAVQQLSRDPVRNEDALVERFAAARLTGFGSRHRQRGPSGAGCRSVLDPVWHSRKQPKSARPRQKSQVPAWHARGQCVMPSSFVPPPSRHDAGGIRRSACQQAANCVTCFTVARRRPSLENALTVAEAGLPITAFVNPAAAPGGRIGQRDGSRAKLWQTAHEVNR